VGAPGKGKPVEGKRVKKNVVSKDRIIASGPQASLPTPGEKAKKRAKQEGERKLEDDAAEKEAIGHESNRRRTGGAQGEKGYERTCEEGSGITKGVLRKQRMNINQGIRMVHQQTNIKGVGRGKKGGETAKLERVIGKSPTRKKKPMKQRKRPDAKGQLPANYNTTNDGGGTLNLGKRGQ